MNFTRSFLLLAAAVTLLSVSSCKKDDESNNTPAPTKFQLLTGHDWKLNQAFEDSVDVTNLYLSPCDLDNIYAYGSNYNYTVDEGPTKCDPTDPQINDSGTWAFANNQNMLVLNSGTPDEGDLTIVQLDATSMKLQEVEYDSSTGTSITYLFSFVKN